MQFMRTCAVGWDFAEPFSILPRMDTQASGKLRWALRSSVVALLTFCVSALAQPVSNPLPLELTQDDVTLRITHAGFLDFQKTAEGMRTGTGWGAPEQGRPGFTLRYGLHSPKARAVTAPPGSADFYREWRTRNEATLARLFAPTGELLTPTSGRSEAGDQPQIQLQWGAVNPRWDHVTLEVLALDPAAPLEAAGNFSQMLVFKDVPRPRIHDKAVPVDAFLQTERGTTIWLNSVLMRMGANAQAELEFNFQWEAPPNVPDLRVSYTLDKLLDAEGNAVSSSGGGSGGNAKDRFHLRIYPRQLPKTDTMTIVVRLGEEATSLRQAEKYRRFRCDLKLPTVVEPGPIDASKVQTLKTPDVVATLEHAKWWGTPYMLFTWLWLRPADNAKDAGLKWFIKDAVARNQDGRPLTTTAVQYMQSPSNQVAWRRDGLPAAPGENPQYLNVNWGDKKPEKVSLDATVEERRYHRHVGDFLAVPLPAVGQTLDLNTHPANTNAASSADARLILRRVVRMGDPQSIPDLLSWNRPAPPAGSVIMVFEVIPSLPDGDLRFQGRIAEDEAGRPLYSGTWIEVRDGIMPPFTSLRKTAKGRLWTMLLRPPAPDAKNLRVQVVMDESQPTGRQTTVRFADVPVPQPPF